MSILIISLAFLSDTVIRKSSTCLVQCGTQIYSRYLANAATKQGRIAIPSTISSLRRFSFSPSEKSNELSVNNIRQEISQVENLLSQLDSIKGDFESLRKNMKKSSVVNAKEEVTFVDDEDSLLKVIELEISKAESCQQGKKLPCGFKVSMDCPVLKYVSLEVESNKKRISLQLYKPRNKSNSNYQVPLIVFCNPQAHTMNPNPTFYCTISQTGFVINKIKDTQNKDHAYDGIVFSQLPSNLQDEFRKYLDVRRINHSNAKILYEYAVNKMKRENLKSLEMFKGLEVDTSYLRLPGIV